jgi:hypothetical protein
LLDALLATMLLRLPPLSNWAYTIQEMLTSTVGMHWDTPLNISSNINNENRDCKISTVWRGQMGGAGWMKEIVVDGFHIPLWKRIKKPLAIVLNAARRRVVGQMLGALWN